MTNPITISQFVPHQTGMTYWVRENFPLFMDFVTAYYEWLEQSGNVTQRTMILLDQRDVDKTLEQFLSYFQFEFLPNIPNSVLADKRQLVKHIRDFYRARGSERSFRFLFRILYNEDLNFYYPSTDMLFVSDGKWTIDSVIRTTTNNDTTQYVARQIVGATSHATAGVENVVQLQINGSTVSEIYISNLVGQFQIGETVHVTTPDNVVHSETTYGLATGIDITNPGTGYRQGDLITVSGSNKTAIFAVNVVTGVITGRTVAAGQASFPVPATIQLASSASDVDGYFNNMQVEIVDGLGKGQLQTIVSYDGSSHVAILANAWITVPDVTSIYSINTGVIQTIRVQDFGINYSSSAAANFAQSGNGDATGTITFGAVGHYAGRYATTDGFLSWDKYIQDSFFYQVFSYVLKSSIGVTVYQNIVKKLLHPASFIFFGKELIDNHAVLVPEHTPSTSIVTSTFDTGSLPTLNLVAQYACIQDLVDVQKVFDVSAAYPTGHNAFLGDTDSAETTDPTFLSQGLQVMNTYANADSVPVSLTGQTLVVAFSPSALAQTMSPVGCIDLDNDDGVSGYQINVNPDGSISFRVQKITPGPVTNNLTVNYGAGSVLTNNYYFASLRYGSNTLTGNLGTRSSVTNAFGTNVDGLTQTNNSNGYFLGAGGFPEPALGAPLYGKSLYGSTLLGIPGTIPSFSGLHPGYFNGIVAYVMVYSRYLTDDETATVYQFIKTELNLRGITLS